MEWCERGQHNYFDESEYQALLVQRNELLAALKWFYDGQCHCEESMIVPCVQCAAGSAIDKAERV